jgi:hypothetical protein
VEGRTVPAEPLSGFFVRSIASAPGAYLSCNIAFRREALEAAGGFDEKFSFPHGEDIDLCLRIRDAGGTIAHAPGALALHAVLPSGPLLHFGRVRLDPSTYRLFALHPERFREAAAVSLLPAFLRRPGRTPGAASILLYIEASRALHAWFSLRDGPALSDRMAGLFTNLACMPLHLLQLPGGIRAHRDALRERRG